MIILISISTFLISLTAFGEPKPFEAADNSFETESWSLQVPGYGNFTVYKELRGEPMNAPYHVRVVVGCSDPKQYLAEPLKPVMTHIDVCSLDKYEIDGDSVNLHMKVLPSSSESPKCTKKVQKISAKNLCKFYRAPDSVSPKQKAK